MTFPVARFGDTSTHGGKIITSAKKTEAEGMLVARVTDLLDCPIHGINPIITGSQNYIVEDQKCARTTSLTQCGAQIIGGSKKTVCS